METGEISIGGLGSRLELRASLFGAFHLAAPCGGEIVISNRRAKTMLAMLCLAPDQPIDREYLSKLLWPGRFEAQARASLRQCLLELSKMFEALSCDLLDVTRSRIALNSSSVQTDIDVIENTLASGLYDKASAMLAVIGKKLLLDQMHFGDDFDTWLAAHRPQAEQRLKVAVQMALDRLEQDGDMDRHAKLLNAWRIRYPWSDTSSKTYAIADRNLGKARVAVLPFRSMAIPDDQGFFADGIVDELITTLGQVPQLLVAGRTSSFHFKGSDKTLPEIAAALNVSHLVEGSVQRQDEQVRINVSLIDGASGFELWSYAYDGSFDHIFATRKEVGAAVNDGITQALDLPSQPNKIRGMTDNREAYGLYLQGRALTIRAIGDGVMENAVHLLEKALELDPQFAECWTALAEAEINVTVYTPCLNRLERAEKAAGYARKAIELAPEKGHARIVLAFHEWTKNNIVGALDLAFEAYELEPNNADVVNRLGSFLLYIGRCEQALPYIEASIDQDPVNGRAYAMLSTVHLNMGNIDAAIAAGKRMEDLGFPTMWLAQAILAKGDHELAIETYLRSKLLMNSVLFAPAGATPMPPAAMDQYWNIAARGVCSGEEQARETYFQVLEMMHATLNDPCDPSIAWPAVWMGRTSLVFRTLGQQITPANFFCLMSLWSDFEPARQTRLHPDFMEFAQRTGLVAAWDKYGWPDLLQKPSANN
jgi:TolB-like protein/DNA-binding SARP family transcriptional activator